MAMMIAHLTASRFFGGPERQMLGLARTLAPDCRSAIVSFAEGGACRAFLDEACRAGVTALALRHDTPRLWAAVSELTERLRQLGTRVLCCHGYKADLLGLWAAHWLGIPAVAVARGWTGESPRVRLYESLDRVVLRCMHQVVCVSDAQARMVRRAGVPAERTRVIRNAIDLCRFTAAGPADRARLQRFFPEPKRWLVGAAGRLSPEKGFQVLVPAAARVVQRDPSVGFVLFGDGALRERLAVEIERRQLQGHFILAGFRDDLDALLPACDMLVLPSFTEGLPNVVLEAMAAQVPVVATAVGGTPELVEDGVTGFLVPPGNAEALAERIGDLLHGENRRWAMSLRGRERVEAWFSFAAQGRQYLQLFEELIPESVPPPARLLARVA